MRKTEILLLVLVMGLSLVLGLYRLDNFGVGLHGDEAETGLQAAVMFDQLSDWYKTSSFYHMPMLGFLPFAVAISLFGQTVWAIRSVGVVFAVGGIPAFYFLLRQLDFGRQISLVGTVLLATSHYWIAFGRLGIGYNQPVALGLLGLGLLAGGVKKKKGGWRWLLAAGAVTGLAQYTYFSARILPLLSGGWLVMWLAQRKRWPRLVREVGWYGLGFFLVVSPLLYYYGTHAGAFNSRVSNVYIFSSQTAKHLISVYGTTDKKAVLAGQAGKLFNLAGDGGDSSGQYGYRGRVLPGLMVGLIIAGLVMVLGKAKKPRNYLLLIWLGGVLTAGGLLTVDPPFWPRLLPVLPALVILVLVSLEAVLKKGGRGRRVVVLLASVGVMMVNLMSYWVGYRQQNARVDGNRYWATQIGYVLREGRRTYLLTTPRLGVGFAVHRYLSPTNRAVEYNSDSRLKSGNVVIALPHRFAELDEVAKQYPGGRLERIFDRNGNLGMEIYYVE